MGIFKSCIEQRIKEQEQLNQLRVVCGSSKKSKDAIEYCKSSIWSMQTMIEYITITGILPTPEMAKYPNFAVFAARSGWL